MNAILWHIAALRLQRDNIVAKFPHGTGHIIQRLMALKANLCRLTGLHLFDQQLCFDKCHWTDLVCNI